jgi:hypothetical protein
MRKLPKGCEMVFTDKARMINNKITKCNNENIKYYCETNQLFYCSKCSHEMAKRNSKLEFTSLKSFCPF